MPGPGFGARGYLRASASGRCTPASSCERSSCHCALTSARCSRSGASSCGQHHHAVLRALAFAHDDGALLELEVLDAQAQRLEQPHARAVEQLPDQSPAGPWRGCACRAASSGHLVGRQHHRQPAVLARAADLAHPGQLKAQHLLVQEQQGRQGLLVGGRRHLPLGRQPGQEGFDLGPRQLGRMAQAVVADEGAHPVHIGLFGAQAVVTVADLMAQLVEQARRAGLHQRQARLIERRRQTRHAQPPIRCQSAGRHRRLPVYTVFAYSISREPAWQASLTGAERTP
jgi:hypothetical protein